MLKREPQQGRSRGMVDDILTAATRVLNSHPLREVTTNHIADVAGISIGSLYQYFDSKQAIIGSLLERHQVDSIAQANRILTECEGNCITSRYRIILRELVALHERERGLHLNFLEFDSRGPAVIGAPPAVEHIQLLSQLLCEEFLNLAEQESALHAQVLIRTVHALVHGAIRLPSHDRDQKVVQYFDAFASSYHRAIATRAVG